MKQFISANGKTVLSTIALLLVGGIAMSFQDSPFSYHRFAVQENSEYSMPCNDTIPDKENNSSIKMKDLERIQSELNQSMLQVSDELKKIDFSKIQKEIEASLKTVDAEKMLREVERSLKDIDLGKTLASVSASLKDIDLDIKSEAIEKALADTRQEIEQARKELGNIDRDAVKKELEEARKEVEKSKAEISKIDMNKIIDEAKAGIEKAKEELANTKELITALEKDGLVNSRQGFTLEYRNGSLYIDGKKQSEETTDKYRRYLKKDGFKIRIEKE
jgi:chromosome segregation ATPase